MQGTRRVKIHKATRDSMREAALNPLAMHSRGRFVYMTGVQVALFGILCQLMSRMSMPSCALQVVQVVHSGTKFIWEIELNLS